LGRQAYINAISQQYLYYGNEWDIGTNCGSTAVLAAGNGKDDSASKARIARFVHTAAPLFTRVLGLAVDIARQHSLAHAQNALLSQRL